MTQCPRVTSSPPSTEASGARRDPVRAPALSPPPAPLRDTANSALFFPLFAFYRRKEKCSTMGKKKSYLARKTTWMQPSRPNWLLINAVLRIKFVCWRQERLQFVVPPQWLELIQQCKELTISVYLPPALAHRGRLARFALICVNSFGHRLKCVKRWSYEEGNYKKKTLRMEAQWRTVRLKSRVGLPECGNISKWM